MICKTLDSYALAPNPRGVEKIFWTKVCLIQIAVMLAFAFLLHLYRLLGFLQNSGADYYLIGVFLAFVVYGSCASVLFHEQSENDPTAT